MQRLWRMSRAHGVQKVGWARRWLLYSASLSAVLVGCSSGSTSASKRVCESDEAIACRADSGCSGYKHCNEDGSGYGRCDCGLGNDSTAHQAGNANITSTGPFDGLGLGGAATSISNPSGVLVGGTGTTLSGALGSGGTATSNSKSALAAGGGISTGVGATRSGGTAGVGGTTIGDQLDIEIGAGGGPVFRREKSCDANGENCKCLNLASFGTRASNAYGVGADGNPSSTTAFEVWLADKSSATVSVVPEKPDLSAAYLASFDVILLQDLREWSLSSVELANLANWVKEGGGLIALSGYFNDDDAEVIATNQVLAFSGMSYEGGAAAGSVPSGVCPDSSRQLCPRATASCCYCWNNTVPIRNFAANHPLTKYISTLGAYMGRSIHAGDGTVLATFSLNANSPAKTVAATKPVGLGQVVLWCDDWITYTRQWQGGFTNDALPEDQLQYEACYDTEQGHWLTADYVFQTKQFWYNLISQVSPPTECAFRVDEPEVDNWDL